MSEFGRLWKQQNNMLCTERCQSLQSVELEVGHNTDAEGEEEDEAVLANLT